MNEPAKPLRIFLSYAHADVLAVRKLHRYLREKGFDVWFDEERLFGGQDWRLEIEDGLNNSDVVIACLSQTAVSKEGFFQREFKFALDRALNMPDGRIFLIPVRLDNCKMPTRLNRYHWVDLFKRDGLQRLIRALKLRAEQLQRADVDESQPINIPNLDENMSGVILVEQDEAAEPEKQSAEDKLQVWEKAEVEKKGLAEIKVDDEKRAEEKEERDKHVKLTRARTQAPLKTLFSVFGGLLVIGGCLSAWWLAVTVIIPIFDIPISTPTPTSLATFTPNPPGNQFYAETFDGKLDNYTYFNTGTGDDKNKDKMSLKISNGFLVFDLKDTNLWIYITYNSFTYHDVTIQLTVDNRNNNVNDVSLLCRYTKDVGWYEFNISNNGSFKIFAYDATDTVHQGYNSITQGSSTAVNPGKDINAYSATCSGNTLTLTINGTEVKRIEDSKYNFFTGKVGFSVSSYEITPILVNVDLFKISKP